MPLPCIPKETKDACLLFQGRATLKKNLYKALRLPGHGLLGAGLNCKEREKQKTVPPASDSRNEKDSSRGLHPVKTSRRFKGDKGRGERGFARGEKAQGKMYQGRA